VENEKGNVVRCGKRGEFIKPFLPPFALTEDLSWAENPTDSEWLVNDGLQAETPYYVIQFA